MRIENINSSIFRGKLVTVGEFSNKPKECVEKISDKIEKLIKPKEYNLFLQQDYSKGEMGIIADYPFPLKPHQKELLFVRAQTNIPITSKASKYLDAAKKTIEQFDDNVRKQEQLKWEQKQKKQKIEELKDIVGSIVLFPLFLVSDILHSINPKWSKKFEELIIDRL